MATLGTEESGLCCINKNYCIVCIQKLLLEGKIEGMRGRGRPRVAWMKKHQRMVSTRL